MSRSNPSTQIQSPCTRFFEWDGVKGGFTYYDKEKKEEVAIAYPFRFLVLDQLTSIKGYSKALKSGFWSNEIRDTKSDQLTVRSKSGVEMVALYDQVKRDLFGKGAEYCKSVYVGYYDLNKKLVIGNIAMKGCAIGPWIDFCKKIGEKKLLKIIVEVKSHIEGKNGITVFPIPVFEEFVIKDASNLDKVNAEASALDEELQMYLSIYLEKNKSQDPVVNQGKATVKETLEVHEAVSQPAAEEEGDSLPF